MPLPALSIIIPASNEAHRIGGCLASLAAQAGIAAGTRIDVTVVANGCHDATAATARAAAPALAGGGMELRVIERATGGKTAALNAGDAAAAAPARLYLDADIVLSDRLVARLLDALASDAPVYAGARLVVAPPRSRASRLYARFWQRLPFMTDGVTGAGLFAVNGAGRRRWSAFPEIIADDAFVRRLFAPHERRRVEATYLWPLNEGFGQLVRVRRRQDEGVRELDRLQGRQEADDAPAAGRILRLAARDPLGFATYAAVRVATRVGRGQGGWDRGTR